MAAPKYLKKLAVLAKIETTVGTYTAPSAGQAIEVSDVTLTPIEGDEVSRGIIKPYFGASKKTLATRYRKISFSVGLAGVAEAGDVAPYDALLQACGATSTNTPETSTVYTPRTDAIKSLSILAVIDKVAYKMRGARGNFRCVLDAKGSPVIQFEFTGGFVPVEDLEAMPTVEYTTWQEPFPVNMANTTIEIDGVSVVASNFQLDAGNTVVKQDLVGADETDITGRESTITATFRNTDVATKNWIGMVGEMVEIECVHGPESAAPNVVTIAASLAQVGKTTYSEQDGIQMVTVPFTLIPSDSGDDEWSITV